MTNQKDFAICEPMYLPPVSFLKMLKSYKGLHLEIHEHFKKSTYRNRCYLPSANGIQLLSIPLLKGKNEKIPMNEVEICYRQNWQREHFKTLKVIYRKSPFFEFYEHELEQIFQQQIPLLVDWNIGLLKFVLQKMNFKTELKITNDYQEKISDADDFRNHFSNLKNENSTDENIMKYHQVFENKIGFQSNMSVLDLLFAEGNNAHSFI